MATTTTTTSGALGVTFFDRMNNVRHRWTEAAAKRRTYRTTLNELSALSDRELSDLNLSRATIPSVAHQAAYGDY